MRRRWQNGQLPGAYRDEFGHIQVPLRTLKTISKRAKPTGLSQRYVSDALWIFRRVMAFARANMLFPVGFDRPKASKRPSPTWRLLRGFDVQAAGFGVSERGQERTVGLAGPDGVESNVGEA
jgi:hypothetical protein